MRPVLSIVIPSRNRPDLLDACLRGVTRHAPANCEVVVVDDGSVDASISAVASRHPGVRTVRLEVSSGVCVAATAGVQAARGAIVELLNDDTEVTAGWAAAALSAFADPTVGAVAPLVLRWPGEGPDGPIVDSAGDHYFLGGVAGKRGHGQRLAAEHLRAGRVFGASGSSAFYRRQAFLDAGGYPEEFGAYFEDVDLSFRLHWLGWEVVYVPESRVLHHVSASHGRPDAALLRQQSRNEERVFWRNLSARWSLVALPLHALVLLGKAWRRTREGTLKPFLRGRVDALRELPRLLRARRVSRTSEPAAPARAV